MADEGGRYIFAEDVVCLKENGTKLGLVLKNGSNLSDSDDSLSSDEEEEDEKVKTGELLICWYPSGLEEVVPESKIQLADRSLQPGDVVRHKDVKRSNYQKGYVTDIQITADLYILGTQQVIKNVDCKKYVTPLEVLSPWTRIAFGPWVGYIKNVYRRVVLWLKNGSRCSVEEEQLSMLYDVVEKRDEDCPFYNSAFFPSQSVVGPARAFKDAKWLSKLKPILNDQNQIKAVVEESYALMGRPLLQFIIEEIAIAKAKVVKIDVEWIVCGSCPPGCKKEDCAKPPAETLTEDQLDQVKVFQHYQQAGIQIGDKGYYVVKEEDVPHKESKGGEGAKNVVDNEPSDSTVTETGAVICNGNLRGETEEQSNDHKDPSSMQEQVPGGDGATTNDIPGESCEGIVMNKTLLTVNHRECVDTGLLNTDMEESDFQKRGEEVNDISKPESAMTSCLEHSASKDDDTKQEGSHVSESDDGDVESDGPDQLKTKTSKQDLHSGLKHPLRRRRKKLRYKRKPQYTVRFKCGDRVCVEVLRTKTLADITWQDGHRDKGVDTLDVIPSYHIDEHQFFPGYFVGDKRVQNPDEKYGVVHCAEHNDRTCTVKWFKKTGESLNVEEDVSVYDIEEHPDFVFNPGDLVVGISTTESPAVVRSQQSQGQCQAGQVVSVNQDGEVIVAWVGGGGSQYSYKPQDLYKVDSEDEDEGESESYSDDSNSQDSSNDSDADEWETASEESSGHEARDQTIDDQDNSANLIIASPPDNAEPTSPTIENVDMDALNNANNMAPSAPVHETAERTSEKFLMLNEAPESHHFKKEGVSFSPTNSRKFMSVLRKEMMLLQASLPPGILFRGFDNAMGLFSILIHGPEDTPYEDGLFLFEMSLPADYPSSPPSVFFISCSKNALNPNLYVDGTVCVSLLGTWNGKHNEIWTPKSNILQVLLSIQGLILCKEPYYNEAGFDKHRGTVEGRENSRLYNENVILQLVASTITLLQAKNSVFDKEIKEHFKKNGHKMIKRFQCWISQAKRSSEGKVTKDGTGSPGDNENSCTSSEASAKSCKMPEFPLLPLSKGFLICFERSIDKLSEVLKSMED